MQLKAIALISGIACSAFQTAKAQETSPKKQFAIAADLLHFSEDNVGFGFNYEQFLNSRGTVSLYLPFSYALPVNNTYWDNGSGGERYIDLNYQTTGAFIDLHDEWTEARGMAYFYPGIKVYPASKLRRVSFCIGASLVLGVGRMEQNSIDYTIDTLGITNQYLYYKLGETSNTSETVGRLKLGMMVTSAINIRVDKHIYTGVELGFGYTYVNMEGNENIHRSILAQAGLKFGYYR